VASSLVSSPTLVNRPCNECVKIEVAHMVASRKLQTENWIASVQLEIIACAAYHRRRYALEEFT